MRAETRLAAIMAMPDGKQKLYKLWEFTALCTLPDSLLRKKADCEILRLSVKGIRYYNSMEDVYYESRN